ncbi:MAG: hypothetical protein B7Z73_13740 [Planctomycetia bacterium 21-64-5]|nr:MAG: hypothetical protein B7Z73_13740 [Planctomycetia bacterium 21-64-5]HQU44844.1 TlpA disulfide reductase family protein [Pirellulales bacterium]
MKHTAAALIAMFALLGCQKPPGPAPTAQADGAAEPATQLPDQKEVQPADDDAPAGKVTVEIKDFDGIQELIASKRGKVVVMDCWSTYCGPCVKEFPGLVALGKEYGPGKLACISLSFNYDGGKKETPEEHKEAVLEFLQSQQATFDNVIASVPAETLYQQLGFKSASVPAIFVYDREGNLARQFEGGDAKYSDVGELVAKLLE